MWFFEEFTVLQESLATYSCRFYVVSDLNIHLERPMDSVSQRFNKIMDMFNFQQYVTEPTHDLGRLLDVVIGPRDSYIYPDEITVDQTCLSDHRPVHWITRVVSPRQSSRL